jgi:hypothetical protein
MEAKVRAETGNQPSRKPTAGNQPQPGTNREKNISQVS